jgi:putative aldouronate transport system substrate-binding protein
MKKSVLGAVAFCLLAGTLAGCGDNGKGTNDNKGAADKEVDNGSEKLALTVMAASVAGGGWTESNPPIIEKLNEKLNIDLKLQWVPSDNYAEKLNVIAASNNFPDAFSIPQTDIFNKWKSRDVFLDIKPHLGKYPNLTKYLDQSGFEFINPPGKYYGLPHYAPAYRDSLVIRQDWLDKLKLKAPTTIDEFYNVAKAFANGDPDGNGQKDTIGYSLAVAPLGGFINAEFLMGGFGLANGWKEEKGQLIPVQTQTKELKDFVGFLRKAVDEGVLDKDFAVNKNRDPLNKFEASKVGFAYANINEMRVKTIAPLKKIDPNSNVVQLLPPKGPTGLQATPTLASTGKMVINAKTDAKKQQRLLKLFDYMASDEGYDLIKNGIEGVHYKKNANGAYEMLPAFSTDRPQLISTWMFRRYDPGIQIRKWDEKEFADQVDSWYKANEKFSWPNPGLGLDSEMLTKQGTNLYQKWTETLVKVIYGKEPLESIDKAVADWKSGGGDKIVEEINAEYKKTK